jgi:glyoxylase-like metal-dependent hydrolase (beta-lactamase superfamily II)
VSERHGAITREGERFPPPRRDLDFLAGEPPVPGTVRVLAAGVLWTRLPLPMELAHINVWLLDDGEGWTLIDTGLADEPSRVAWHRLEDEVLGGRSLRRIVVTHDHPDHVGLAPWLADRHGAEVWMSAAAHCSCGEFLRTEPEVVRARMRSFLRSHGVELPPGLSATPRTDHRDWFGGIPELQRSLADGDLLQSGAHRWQVIETAGHCRGHLCLWQPELALLVSGDQVLPSISPNVSVLSSRPDDDPLREFLASLDRLDACAPDTLVLPSHGRPFVGLQRRTADLRRHHHEQLDTLRHLYVEARTAAEALPVLFGRPLRGFHRILALGEAVAHLNYLWAAGEFDRQVDAQGLVRYVRN